MLPEFKLKFCSLYFQNQNAIAGVIDLGTVETFPVFQAAQRGLIDQDTATILLETQLILGGLLKPDSSVRLSLEESLAEGLIDTRTKQCLSELESALNLIETIKPTDDQQQNVLPVATAMESGLIREEVGLRILSLQINTGGLRTATGKIMSLEQVEDRKLLNRSTATKLRSRLQHRELIDPNTAEKLNLQELQRHCVPDNDTGLLLLPVKQQPGGTVCLQTGRKVGIFRAVQEGLIDRMVTVRLLEAQLFAGGIADPRSGHRLTIDEAVRHGLMDQDLACAMLARQLQNGGILDPVSGERLDLEEGICRGLLSSRLAVVVLESLWAFMGILWPESGELLPIVEAVQQGVISGELSRNILKQRHAIGALYNPDTLQILPLNQAAEAALAPSVVGFLRDAYIPDVLSNMNQSGTPSLNRLSWGSSSSSPTTLSPPPSSSSEGIICSGTPTHEMDPEEQAKHKLLFHLMTHSYVDAHSGKRLVLLDPELVEVLKATGRDSEIQVEQQFSLKTDPNENATVVEQFSLTEKELSERQTEIENNESSKIQLSERFEMNGTGSLGERFDHKTDNRILQDPVAIAKSDEADSSAKLIAEKNAISDPEVLMPSAENIEEEFPKNPDELEATKPSSIVVQEKRDIEKVVLKGPGEFTTVAPLKPERDIGLLKESVHQESTTNDFNVTQPDYRMDTEDFLSESENIKQEVLTVTKSNDPSSQIESAGEKEEDNAEFARLALELKQGGLLSEDGEKLLPDEAVAQGVLTGYMAVKLMAEASLFGGFLDANSVETLGMEDVLQEGLFDEDLMWSVLKSDKSLSGVVDAEKRRILSVSKAAQEGLIDLNTATRLLEAQVTSGGIVDLCRDKKVSVTLAANLGLIEEEQKEELIALERAYKGKDTDLATALTKANLQLQMEGLIDPESKFPVPLEQAIQKGLIRPKEAYQVLAQQVAEGGVIHHASGMRLSVRDAVNRGLVDRSISSGLEELEWVYQGKMSPSSHPEALTLQASTGAVLDPDSGCKLTLTEAVSKGLLDDDVANQAMVSSAVTKGVLDPQTARVVPFSDLVRQGKIDVETGKRFLEVKPFRGIRNDKTEENLTLPEAVASKKVDPIPALRLLQSQADTGGIVDINTGERLPLFEACKRGLVDDKMVKVIAKKQLLKGGLIDPDTRQQTSSLQKAIEKRLISPEVALEIQEKLASEDMETDKGSTTGDASPDETYSRPAVSPSLSSPDNQAHWSDTNTHVPSSPLLSKTEEVVNRQNDGKTETSVLSNQPQLYDSTMDKVKAEVPVSGEDKGLSSIETGILQPVEKVEPQSDINKSEPPSYQKLDDGLQKSESETDYKRIMNTDIPGDSIQAQDYNTDKDFLEEKVGNIPKLDEEPVKGEGEESLLSNESALVGDHDSGDGNQSDFVAPEAKEEREGIDHKTSRVTAEPNDVEERSRGVEKEKPLALDIERTEPLLTFPPKLTQSKTKKRKKSKKNGKGKEAEETHPEDGTHSSHIDQVKIEVKPEGLLAVPEELKSQDRYAKTQIYGQVASVLPLHGDGEVQTDQEIAEKFLVKQDQEVVPAVEKSKKHAPELEKDTVKIVKMMPFKDKKDEMQDMKRKEPEEKVEEATSVSQLPEQPKPSQETEKRKEQELLHKSDLPDDEKAALVLKAKEKIMKKVFEKGVSEKQAAQELQALRNEGAKKESKSSTDRDVGLSVNGKENHSVKDGDVKKPNGSPKESEKGTGIEDIKEKPTVKMEDATAAKISVKETVKVKPLEDSPKEIEKSIGDEGTTTALPDQTKQTQPSKQKKRNKKKNQNVKDITEDKKEKLLTLEKVHSDMTEIPANSEKATPDFDISACDVEGITGGQSASDVIRPSLADKIEASKISVKEAESSPTHLNVPEEPISEDHMQLSGVISPGCEESHESGKPDTHPTDHPETLDTQPDKETGKDRKKEHLSPGADFTDVSESKSFEDKEQKAESSESAEDASSVSELATVLPECDTATESLEKEADVRELVSNKEEMTSQAGKVGSFYSFIEILICFYSYIDVFLSLRHH